MNVVRCIVLSMAVMASVVIAADRVPRASVPAKAKNTVTVDTPVQSFDIRPWLYVGAGVALASGITLNIIGFGEDRLRMQADESYNAVASPLGSALAAQYYSESETHRINSSILYIISYSAYAVSAGLLAWAIFAPPPRSKIGVLPVVFPQGAAVAFAMSF